MTWNNRIVYTPNTKTFGVHETFYDNGEIQCFTTNPINLGGYESKDDLLKSLNQIKNDIDKSKDDVVDYDMEFANTEPEDERGFFSASAELFDLTGTSKSWEFDFITLSIWSVWGDCNRSFLSVVYSNKKIKLKKIFFFKIK